MDIKEYIKSLAREILDEMSVSGDAGGYLSAMAFSKKGQGPNAATKQAQRSGWKLAPGMPKNSKVLDYKELWKGKKSSMNETLQPKVGDTIEHIRTGVLTKINKIEGNTIIGTVIDLGDNSIPYVKMGDTNKTDVRLIGKTYNLINNISNLKESLLDIIEKELLNEVTYSKFKKDVKHRTKSEQLHKAIREVKRKLAEIDRIVEYTSRMKQELSEDEGGISYWKATQKNVATISEMVNHLNNKIKNLQQ